MSSFICSPDDLDDDEELLELSKMSVQSSIPQQSCSSRPMDIHTATVENHLNPPSPNPSQAFEWQEYATQEDENNRKSVWLTFKLNRMLMAG